jgi:hypothetical protein
MRASVRKRGDKMRRFDISNKEYWWVTPHEVENLGKSALVPTACVRKQENYTKMRVCAWKIFRRACGREDLNMSSKMLLWSVVERYRFETWSSHDAISYYAKMIGTNRRSAGRGMKDLIEKEILWCVLEGEKKRLRMSQPAGKKHFLLVGLANELMRE